MNSDAALDEAILHPDLRHINFFNGRLLTGGDLQAEQSVQHAHAHHLGMAIGAGVAEGLWVSEATSSPASDAAITITKGMAINRVGQTLRLECDQRVVLARPPDPTKRDQCVFADCEEKLSDSLLGNGAGYYLLTISPASEREERAPVSGLGNGVASCNSRYLTEGVKFSLITLTVTGITDSNTRQSTVAQLCLGLLDPTPYATAMRAFNGFSIAQHGYETLIPPGRLTSADVPLAVVEWTENGLGYIDNWAVRRRLTKPDAEPRWSPLSGDQRLADGEATFSQFQQQMSELLLNGDGVTRAAEHDFIALPPLGVLPMRGTGSPAGIDAATFFGSHAQYPPITLDSAQLAPLLTTSFRFPPLRLSESPLFQLYTIAETVQSVAAGQSNQLVLVFASSALPFVSPWRYGYYY